MRVRERVCVMCTYRKRPLFNLLPIREQVSSDGNLPSKTRSSGTKSNLSPQLSASHPLTHSKQKAHSNNDVATVIAETIVSSGERKHLRQIFLCLLLSCSLSLYARSKHLQSRCLKRPPYSVSSLTTVLHHTGDCSTPERDNDSQPASAASSFKNRTLSWSAR